MFCAVVEPLDQELFLTSVYSVIEHLLYFIFEAIELGCHSVSGGAGAVGESGVRVDVEFEYVPVEHIVDSP